MRKLIKDINKYYLYIVTAVQAVLALIWLVLCKHSSVSVLGIVSAGVVLCAVGFFFFSKGKMTKYVIAAYLLTFPLILDTAIAPGHLALLPGAPAGDIEELNIQRFAWPYLVRMSYFSKFDFLDETDIREASSSTDYLWNEFFPVMEANLDPEFLPEVYREVVKTALKSYNSVMAPALLRDFAYHIASPITPYINLCGAVGSLTGKNYNAFIRGTDGFGRVYFWFGLYSFLGLMVLGIVNFIADRRFVKVKTFVFGFISVAAISLYDMYFTLRGFDYKNTAWITIIYILLFLIPLRRENVDN